MNKYYFEVRIPSDGEFDYLVMPPMENYEEMYDPNDEDSAKAYAESIKGYAVRVEARRLQ